MTHPQSRGIGAWVNTTYFSIAQTIDNSGYALKGNFFSGDLAKDNSDLSQVSFSIIKYFVYLQIVFIYYIHKLFLGWIWG